MTRQEFTDLYRQQLPSVWNYVRSRVPGHHEAQDVTSEVFTRAWRSSGSYDPDRGTITAWLFRIAHHTVVDWYRKQRRLPDAGLQLTGLEIAHELAPDASLLEAETRAGLKRCLSLLKDRERDAVALRFGAGLKVHEVADILGLSTGATKMMISRTMEKMKELLGKEPAAASTEVLAADLLDEAIDDALARRRPGVADPAMEQLVTYMVAVHQEEAVPPGLEDRIAACLSCTPVEEPPKQRVLHRVRAFLARFGLASAPAAATLCPAGLCAVHVTSLGPLVPAWSYVLHLAVPLFAPLQMIPLWFSFQKHRKPEALLLAGGGALLMLLQTAMHYLHFGPHLDSYVLNPLNLGVVLLVAAAIVDLRATAGGRRTVTF